MDKNKDIKKLKFPVSIMPDEGDNLLQPSEKVWSNIKKELPIKKNKKRFFIWLFFFSCLASAGIFTSLYLNNTQSKSNNTVKEQSQIFSKIDFPSSNTKTKKSDTTTANTAAPKEVISNQQVINDGKENHVLLINNGRKEKTISIPKSKVNNNILLDAKTPNNSRSIADVLLQSATPQVVSTHNNLEPDISLNNPAKKEDSERNVVSQLEILPRLPIYILQTNQETDIALKPEIKKSNQNKYYLGLQFNMLPFGKNFKIKNQALSETISNARLTNGWNVGLNVFRPITKDWQISAGLQFSRHDVLTSYDLNIPYDYHTEKELPDKKENYFSHSLPTALGNVTTMLVVARTPDSPVSHNENINIDFEVNYRTYALALPFGVQYLLGSPSKGFLISASVIPAYTLSRQTSVTSYHSNHTFVKEQNASITRDNNFNDFQLYSSTGASYRTRLTKTTSLDAGLQYQWSFTSRGAPAGIYAGLSIVCSMSHHKE